MNCMKIKDSNKIAFNIWWHGFNLKLAQHCYRQYMHTNEQFYLNYAKEFHDWSNKIKKEYIDPLL